MDSQQFPGPEKEQWPNPDEIATREVEQFIGARAFYVVGLILIAVGMGYFMKMAFDLWIGPQARVALGVLAGALCIGIPFLSGSRQARYVREGFVVLGSVIEFFTCYAAEHLFHIADPAVASIGMIATTLSVGTIAWRWKSESLAIGAVLGAWITPVFLGVHPGESAALTAYIGLIDLAFLGLAQVGQWRILPFATIAGNLALFVPQALPLTLVEQTAVCIAFSTLFSVAAHYRTKGSPTVPYLDLGGEILNIGMVLWQIQTLFAGSTDITANAMALLAVAVVQLTMGTSLYFRRNALLPATLAAGVFFHTNFLVGSLALTSLASMGIGIRYRDLASRVYGYALILVAAWFAANSYADFHAHMFLLNERSLNLLCLGGDALFIAIALDRYKSIVEPLEKYLTVTLELLGHAVLFIASTLDIGDIRSLMVGDRADAISQVLYSIVWSAFALLYIGMGFLLQRNYLRWLGITLLSFVLMKVVTVDLASFDLSYRVASALVVGLILLLIATQYQRRTLEARAGDRAKRFCTEPDA